MKIRPRREAITTLESIAITDIILNMFIFFFVSFSLVYTLNPIKESKIVVKLPEAGAKPPAEQAEPAVIVIDAGGRVYLFDKPTGLPALKRSLEGMVARNKDVPAVVRADKTVKIDRVVQVLDVAKGAGVGQIGIAVEEKARPVPAE
jgi:biopolymer transport protein ExbD